MKKKPRKPHFFYCDIYMTNIYYYQNIPASEVVASMLEHLDSTFSIEKFDTFAGKAIQLWSGNYVIWTRFPSKKCTSSLAHECLHIANMILHARGVEVSLENDEAQAYLMGWILKKCLEFKPTLK